MKKALTIGELLIAMAIIGTISALVLPGLIKDYQNRIYVAKLKRVVVQLEQAVNSACVDNNVSYFARTPYVGSKTEFQNFLNNYLKGTSTGDIFASEYGVIGYDDLINFSLSSNYAKIKMSDGAAIGMYCSASDSYCLFSIDTNSLQSPNIGGKDFFTLKLDINKNEIKDNGSIEQCGGALMEAETEDEIALRAAQASKQSAGYGCYARLLQNNWEMNY